MNGAQNAAPDNYRYIHRSYGRRTTEAERPANESLLFAGKAPLIDAVSTRTRAPRGRKARPAASHRIFAPCAQAAVRVVSPDDCNGGR
jgi:hypothetical protein